LLFTHITISEVELDRLQTIYAVHITREIDEATMRLHVQVFHRLIV